MKESTVILTSLYSQIYSPSHRQKEQVEEGKKESTTMSVGVNQNKSCIDIMEDHKHAKQWSKSAN